MKSNEIIRLIHRGTGGQQGLMATIPASCYKDPPKIVVLDEVRNCNEQNNSNRKYKKRNSEVQ